MANRTTDGAVEGIVEVDSTIPVDPFIEVANALVTEVCASVLNDSNQPYYDSTRLELIERWLSAHFYCIRDPRTTLESAGFGVSEQFESKVNYGFNITRYGQMALRLDTAGGLAKLDRATDSTRGGQASTASGFFLGNPNRLRPGFCP